MGLNIGITNDYLLNSSNVPNDLQKYVLWAKARQGGSPGLKPTLDLDFATNKSLVDNVSGQNLVTFTRASSGTYVGSDGLIKSAAVNEARFDHNPTTLESLGLLVEEARTNLLTYSQEFDNAAWSKDATTITSNNATSPDGTVTAELVVPDTQTLPHMIRQAATLTAATHTISIYAKASGYQHLQICDNISSTDYINFVLSGTGSVGNASGYTGSIVSVGNGWYRVSASKTFTAASTEARFVPLNADTAARRPSFAGNGTSGILLWGAQLEAGSFPTSYIPTVASTVTRSADVARITGANFSSWYRQGEGTLFASGAQLSGTIPSDQYIVSLDDNSSSNFIKISRFNGGNPVTVRTSGTSVFDVNLGSISQSSLFSSALTYKQNSFAGVLNGTGLQTSTSGSVPLLLNSFRVGSAVGPAAFANGTIRRLTYWPTRLPNATLQQITQ